MCIKADLNNVFHPLVFLNLLLQTRVQCNCTVYSKPTAHEREASVRSVIKGKVHIFQDNLKEVSGKRYCKT